MEFCAIESCGKCTPCRIGSTQVRNVYRAASTVLPEDPCDTLKFGSLCGLGDFTPYPLTNALTHFRDDFGAPPRLQAAE
jgi:formate dehydrogenase iron-sulfur subunit